MQSSSKSTLEDETTLLSSGGLLRWSYSMKEMSAPWINFSDTVWHPDEHTSAAGPTPAPTKMNSYRQGPRFHHRYRSGTLDAMWSPMRYCTDCSRRLSWCRPADVVVGASSEGTSSLPRVDTS